MKALDLAQRFALWLVWFLAPLEQTVLAILALVAADVVTGIWASIKKGKRIESRTMRQTVTKTIGYLSALVLCLIVEPFAPDALPVVKIMSGFIAMIEFQSAIENLSVITGVDLWAALRGRVKPSDAGKDGAQ